MNEREDNKDYIFDAFDNQPLHIIEGNKYLTNTLTDHSPATSPEFVQQVLDEFYKATDFSRCDKVVGDEERGGHITAIAAFMAHKPYSLMKWNPSGVIGEFAVPFTSAYASGNLFLNGILKGDSVIIAEDFIDTGGTIVAMVTLLREIGVEVLDIVAVAEKVDFDAHARILRETGIDPKVLVSVSIEGETSKVVSRQDF